MKQENIKTNVLNRLYDNYNMKRLLILFISIFCILVAYAEHVAIDDAKQVKTETKTQYLSLLENDTWLLISLGYEGEQFITYYSNTHQNAIINGQTYTDIEVYGGEMINDVFYKNGTRHIYVRENRSTGKSYSYNKQTQSEDLLFDFSLQVGDTFPHTGVIENIEIVNINGIERRQLTFNNYGIKHAWIEGIGSTGLGLSPYFTDPNWRQLICVTNEGNNVYEHAFHGVTCNSFTEYTPTSIFSLNINPNPVHDRLKVEYSVPFEKIRIFNLNGQCVLQSTQTDIDVSALPQGMYILRAVTTTATPLQAKFIKE